MLARALLVPPVVLMFPLHTDAEVTWSPGATAHPWHAIRWFSEEGRQPVKPRGGGEYDAATDLYEWYEEERRTTTNSSTSCAGTNGSSAR